MSREPFTPTICQHPEACCLELSRVWRALGIHEYNGKSASENVAELREQAASQARELAALRAGQAWQPIETAPKGRVVIMWGATDIGPDGEIRNWKMATGNYSFDGDYLYWDGDRLDKPYQHRPTHWLPLPPVPTTEEEG